ncbi:hypothetical protein JJB09_08255 [Rhizobium sp. KVB221]|uniref:Glutamine amidotransferase domain-containing protein n=1 Tax=Rhizobium setariae TaxID=2801340 RepID=A0A936YM25_9HYPH|nr:hypothetical protein [Rhizobium setariae]MBL0372018.1 hypothetical protein [Rhizobium setariae]
MTLIFEPLLPLFLIAILAAIALTLSAFGLYRRQRGAVLRAIALLLLVGALANPVFHSEEREALSTVVAIAADRSHSQEVGPRREQTDKAIAALKDALGRYKGIETRVIDASALQTTDTPWTRIFSSLASALEDVPPSRIGAVIAVTDGQVHDVPEDGKVKGIDAPVHGLITGHEGEFDRRIQIVKAPRFGIVGRDLEMSLRVVDDGGQQAAPAEITIRINGEIVNRLDTAPGVTRTARFRLARAGSNIVEISVAEIDDEVTGINNRVVQTIDGIRENLRVLLVSGEPHAGERAWRNLLKSDASVDLVHFTILRPPEKQDGTPINELSLIAFPTRELFVEKIKDFDLIIFDRYQHRGVLPILYYDNIAQYVREGGALLLVSGPEHAGSESLAYTPLESVLPASPTGSMNEKAFFPRLSEVGAKHPVTRGLQGAQSEPPHWGRWFRSVGVRAPEGNVVMDGPDESPLLVLSHNGEGRVAMLLSDNGWLWARGFEGGGPHVDLYRRIAHWLMKEPALEEEALTARSLGREIEITRQTLGKTAEKAIVRKPDGTIAEVTLTPSEPGLFRGTLKTTANGLYEVSNDDFSTLVHVGAVDAPEFREMVSTTEKLAPVAKATKGVVKRLDDGNGGITLPQILTVRGQVRLDDPDRMVIRMTDETALKGISSLPLFSGLLGLGLLLLAIASTWWREGR